MRIGIDRMLRIQGYTAPHRVRRAVRVAAENAAANVERLLDAQVRFRRVDVEACSEGTLRLAGGEILHCAAFERFLGECPRVVVFVLTAGARIDSELERLAEAERLLDMLFVETAGWLAVEAITRAFTDHLRAAAARQGLRITRRMGPGYTYPSKGGDAEWPLAEQGKLFALLGSDDMPVTMLESSAMQPKMSRSGVIGLLPSAKSAAATPS